jgi:iron complex transport system permease protein
MSEARSMMTPSMLPTPTTPTSMAPTSTPTPKPSLPTPPTLPSPPLTPPPTITNTMRRRTGPAIERWIIGSAALFLLAALLLPLFGPRALDWQRVWQRQEPDWSILTNLRLSRTLLGLFAGGALALAGSLFQSMLRDALATPYTLGVSTGASLGAVVAISLDWQVKGGIVGIWAGALIGAGLILFVVMSAATRRGALSSSSLLLAGIAINSVCAALILLIHGLAGMSQSYAISRWLIGGLDALPRATLTIYAVAVIITAAIVIRQGRQWNLLAVDEAWAATRGVNVRGALVGGYISGSILAATTVALTGPIGFVGLVVPHLLRRRLGADDRVLMPCAFLLGGVLLASCDAIGRVALAPAEIPAGAITAFIGGPHLIWIVRRGGWR